jgi:hypothetical protein
MGVVEAITAEHRELLQHMWNLYADPWDTPDLLGLTHLPGTPWDTAYRNGSRPAGWSVPIPDYLVRMQFRERMILIEA